MPRPLSAPLPRRTNKHSTASAAYPCRVRQRGMRSTRGASSGVGGKRSVDQPFCSTNASIQYYGVCYSVSFVDQSSSFLFLLPKRRGRTGACCLPWLATTSIPTASPISPAPAVSPSRSAAVRHPTASQRPSPPCHRCLLAKPHPQPTRDPHQKHKKKPAGKGKN